MTRQKTLTPHHQSVQSPANAFIRLTQRRSTGAALVRGRLADDEHAVAAPDQVAGDTRAAGRGVTASGPVVVPGTDCKRSSPEPARDGHSSPGNGTFSGQAAATPVRWPGPGVRYGSGGGFDGCDGYLEAEGLEVADVVADLAVAVGVGVVVVRGRGRGSGFRGRRTGGR